MADKLRNLTYNISIKIAYGIFAFICFYLFLSSIFSTCLMWFDTEITYYIKDFALLMVSGLLGMMGLVFLLRGFLRKILTKYRGIMVLCTLIWAVLIAVFASNTDISLVYDQARLYEAVEGMVRGNHSLWRQGGYMSTFPYQNGMVLFYVPIMLIFGKHTYAAVQVLSIVLYWLMAVAFYKLSKNFFDKIVAVFTYIGILFFLPLWGYVKFFYGNLPGLCFMIWALYFLAVYMQDHSWKNLIGSALCLAVAIAFKSNFMIYSMAMLLVLILKSICKKKVNYLGAALIIGLAVICGSKVPPYVAHWITGYPTDQGVPTIYNLVMGLSDSYVAPGWYSGDIIKAFEENEFSVEKSANEAWKDVRESLATLYNNKEYALWFFGRKLASVWNNPTFEGFAVVVKGNLHGTIDYWMKDLLYSGGTGNAVLILLMDILQSVYLFGNVLYLMYCKKEHDLRRGLPLVAFIGGFIFHIFWEGKCQYTLLFFVLFIPYAFAGYKYCIHKIGEWYSGQDRVKRLKKSKKVWAFGVLMAVLLIIGIWNNPIFDATIKLRGDEGTYVWLYKEESYWKSPNFTKEGPRD